MTMIPFKSSTILALALVALQAITMPDVVDADEGYVYNCVSCKKQTRVALRTAIYTYM